MLQSMLQALTDLMFRRRLGFSYVVLHTYALHCLHLHPPLRRRAPPSHFWNRSAHSG